MVFVRKVTRDKILRITNEKPLKIDGREIQVLKQTLWKIRDIRKKYSFLTNKLNSKNINFRWLIPEGVNVNWQGKRYRLDSVEKAEEFDRKHFSLTEDLITLQEARDRKQGKAKKTTMTKEQHPDEQERDR